MMSSRKLTVAIACCLLAIGSASAQVSEETLESITTPDKVETSIGTLNFLDGAPLPETFEKVYDYLDTMRGVDAFLKGMRGASIANGLYVCSRKGRQVLRYRLADGSAASTPFIHRRELGEASKNAPEFIIRVTVPGKLKQCV